MPLYSYIPYLDPDIDEKTKISFSGDIETDDEQEHFENETPKLQHKTIAESFKRKVNENLRNLNNRMTDLLQDGLGGVDNICKQVKCLINDNQQVYAEQCMENYVRGDVYEYREEKRYNSPATDLSQDTIFLINHVDEAKPREIYENNNSVFVMQEKTVVKDDNLPASSKREKSGSRPTSKGLKSKKSDPKSNNSRVSSKSFDATVKTFLNQKSSDKIKSPKTKTKKKAAEPETKPAGENSAKKRLGQIERDYQKVVENLGMVERMMACVNERIMNQKMRKDRISLDTSYGKEKNVEQSKSKKKTIKTIDKRSQPTNDTKQGLEAVNISQKEKSKRFGEIKEGRLSESKEPKEVIRRKRKETKDFNQSEDFQEKKLRREKQETRIAEEIMKQMKSMEEYKNTTLFTNGRKPEETTKNAEQLGASNPLSRFEMNDSQTDIDAMIDNAVMELGNLVTTDFDISQSSSDASFKFTTEDCTLYDKCSLGTSSSTSGSDNELLGEDSEKFEISQSFQELKESYVQKIKQKATDRKTEDKKNLKKSNVKNNPEVEKKNSYDQLYDEIFNDSNWKNFDPMPLECTFLTGYSRNSNSSTDLNKKSKEYPLDKDNLNIDQEDFLNSEIENNNKDQDKEIITISLPSTEQYISSNKKTSDFTTEGEKVAEQLNDDTLQITVTFKGEEEDNQEENASETKDKEVFEQAISENEFPNNSDTKRRQERTLRKQQKKKMKNKKTARISKKEKDKSRTAPLNEEEYHEAEEEADDFVIDLYRRESAEKTSTHMKTNSNLNKVNFNRKSNRPIESDAKDIKEIKKMESNFSQCSSYSSFLSFEEGMFWTPEGQNKEETKPIDPMKQVSIICRKLIDDLVVEEDPISLEKMMDGYFNDPLIQSLVCRTRRPRSVRIQTPIQDPDLRSIVPEVHRKKAIPDLHERMEYQIRQTDSFDGFLNLMNKNRRKALIKQAERQDHNVRCQMKTCFRKRYPFRVVTASVPAGYENKFKDRKEPEKKYINSLWFSPKDFKLRRNSRIFNRKRMEMYCQSLNKAQMIPRCKFGEATSKDNKRMEKASNYSILVRSGIPFGRRPNTPRRWIQLRPPTPAGGISPRPRLHHCDILDDLTLKDLAPFEAEYPRNDDKHLPESLQGSLLHKLACGGQKGDANETLMELVAPTLNCTQDDCKICKCKSRSGKKPTKKSRSPKKSGDEASVTLNKTELQNLTPKATAQLLIQNIGEIKSKKSSTKSQTSERNLNKHKETKTKRSVKSLRKNSRKVLSQDSNSTIQQRLEENMVKRIFQKHQVPIADFPPRSTQLQRMGAFKGIDHFQKILKVPELYSRSTGRKSNITKLFPYINDPDNKVFQNITVLPVKVFYNFEPLRDSSEKGKPEVTERKQPSPRANQPVNITSLSETDELEVSTIECRRPSTADDKNNKKKITGKRRIGTPKSPTIGSRQNPNKFANFPPNPTGAAPLITYPLDVTLNRRSKEIIGGNQETLNSSKISPRRLRFRRSSSLGKSTESDNLVSQPIVKRSGNPNPWKPASRRPRTPKTPPLPKPPLRIRSKERSNLPQLQPCKTISTGWISPRQNSLQHRTFEKCLSDSPRLVQEAKDQHQMQTLVNKDKKIRFEVKPTKNFYDIDLTDTKPRITRTPIQRCRPLSPSQRVMVDHLQMLRNRNSRLQGNIQKAINIIEEKMVDVLSTNDQCYKKKTIDRMEKEINKVLKMINEQNCIMNKKKENHSETPPSDVHKTISKTDSIKCISVTSKLGPEEENQTNTKAYVTHTVGLKMPKPPRKRSISRVLKFHPRPSTVEEEKSFDLAEENELLRINKGAASEEEEVVCKTKDETKVGGEEKIEAKRKHEELYPSANVNEEGETPFCPILRCPTPKSSFTKLSQKTKKILKKMSREAFGKFADVVRTKTRLIIDMTERIDLDDTNLLPNPKVTSALPAILARSTNLPVITTIHQPRPSDLMSTTVSSIVSVHQTPIENFLNASADALSGTATEISEFANGCAERSITSFSESESYTWRKIEQSQPIGLECSTCSLKRKISHDLTPFMRALNNLKAGRLFEKRHQLLPIEETSPNFRKMMGFLQSLSKAKETFNQTTSRDVQLIWNPEKRCSFHNSIVGSKKLRFRKNTKAISDHSMVQSPETSISELFSQIKIEENPSETIADIDTEPQKQPDDNEQTHRAINEKSDVVEEEVENFYEMESKMLKRPKQECKLVFSEVQLISISHTKNHIKRRKKRSPTNADYMEPILMVKDDRYSNFLKLFYLIFYTMVYFCMTIMNFSC